MFDLTDKNALVTGASGGIGGAIARALHAAGARVGLSGTRAGALDALAGELGDGAFAVPADLSSANGAKTLVKDAEAALGGIDILVNNAGLTRDQLAVRMSDEDWQMVLDVNLTAAFRLSRGCLRGMMKKRWGRIVSVTSIVGISGNPGQANYAASKAAFQGGVDRDVEIVGPGSGEPQHHRQLRRAGLYRHADDGRPERRTETGFDRPHPCWPVGGTRGRRRRVRLFGQRRGVLRHRSNLACQRRNGDDIGHHRGFPGVFAGARGG